MTRQELADLIQEASRPAGATFATIADAVIAAGFRVDPEPVTVQLPAVVVEHYAAKDSNANPVSAAGLLRVACREALGMKP